MRLAKGADIGLDVGDIVMEAVDAHENALADQYVYGMDDSNMDGAETAEDESLNEEDLSFGEAEDLGGAPTDQLLYGKDYSAGVVNGIDYSARLAEVSKEIEHEGQVGINKRPAQDGPYKDYSNGDYYVGDYNAHQEDTYRPNYRTNRPTANNKEDQHGRKLD